MYGPDCSCMDWLLLYSILNKKKYICLFVSLEWSFLFSQSVYWIATRSYQINKPSEKHGIIPKSYIHLLTYMSKKQTGHLPLFLLLLHRLHLSLGFLHGEI